MIYISYGFLFLSVMLLWLPYQNKIPYWAQSLVIAIVFGFMYGTISVVGICYLFLLAALLLIVKNKNIALFYRITAVIAASALGLGLQKHLFSGFDNIKVISGVLLSQDAVIFSQYLNFDKTVVGVLILGILKKNELINSAKEFFKMFADNIVYIIGLILVLMLLAGMFGMITIDVKFLNIFWIWAINNLFFVCMAEEALFRGFIQENISYALKRFYYGKIMALILASILFGFLLHGISIEYMLLASIAGFGYGWIYMHTKRIEASIIAHFCVNLTHFLFFTYPILQSHLSS